VRAIASLGVSLVLCSQLLAGCVARVPLRPIGAPSRDQTNRTPTDRPGSPTFVASTATSSEPSSTSIPGSPTPLLKPSVSPTLATPTPHPATIFLDPGHGGVDTGAIGTAIDGATVLEKTVTLAIALRTAAQLRHDGIGVVLYRTDDSLPGMTPADYTSDQTALTLNGLLANLQQRIDRANASGAAALFSIHLNAYDDPAVRGSETVYDPNRPFATQSQRLAQLTQSNLTSEFQGHGYDTPDRGVSSDLNLVSERFGTLGGEYHNLVLLGPGIAGRLRPSTMPGALSEPLFLSNPIEATAVTHADVQDLIATAYTRAIEQFLRGGPAPG
jgi:N-acetylmuramoyl-L-alanine amidase